MMLSRYSSGGKPQSGEDRIGGGMIGLPLDPLLYSRQTLGRLVDVVTVGDVDERREQLLEAFGAAKHRSGRRPVVGAAPRRARPRPHSFVLTHPSAFPRGRSATQSPPVAG
jgi:hypothetical protein